MDDLRAVMDASGCERAAVVGVSEGAPLAISFAVAHPERVLALILYGPLPKATRTDDYPWAQPAEWWESVAAYFERAWGSPEYLSGDVGVAGSQRTRQRSVHQVVGHLPPARRESGCSGRPDPDERTNRRPRPAVADRCADTRRRARARPGDLRGARPLRRGTVCPARRTWNCPATTIFPSSGTPSRC